MNKLKKFLAMGAIAAVAVTGLAACSSSDAETVGYNASKEADSFKVQRKIIVQNGITDKYIMVIEGLCSVDASSSKLTVLCKTGPSTYEKSVVGISDNVFWYLGQTDGGSTLSKYHHTVILKPESVIPGVQVEVGGDK